MPVKAVAVKTKAAAVADAVEIADAAVAKKRKADAVAAVVTKAIQVVMRNAVLALWRNGTLREIWTNGELNRKI